MCALIHDHQIGGAVVKKKKKNQCPFFRFFSFDLIQMHLILKKYNYSYFSFFFLPQVFDGLLWNLFSKL